MTMTSPLLTEVLVRERLEEAQRLARGRPSPTRRRRLARRERERD
jgi:hypothetical protein